MLTIFAVEGIPEVRPGDDLAAIVGDAIASDVRDGDILAVTSKIVSKAEGRLLRDVDREDAISSEAVRVVATRSRGAVTTRIVETRHGLVLAAAGVDSSNAPDGTVLLLPEDPDASARRLCAVLRDRFGVALGVVITDTAGRPWRIGQTDIAIGAAGVRVLDDLRGTADASGRVLDATIAATADEIAGAAELVKGKAAGLPVAVVRGLPHLVGPLELPGARAIVRSSDDDMFRLGADEAYREGQRAASAGESRVSLADSVG